jgi:hypothetical protein
LPAFCPLLERGGTRLGPGCMFRAIPMTLERPAPRPEKEALTALAITCVAMVEELATLELVLA